MARRRVEIESRHRAPLDRLGPIADRVRRRLHVSPLARRILRRRVLGLAMVVVTTAVVHHVVTEADEVRRTWGTTRTVVVAAGPVAAGEPLDAGNTVLERRPDRFVPDGALPELPAGRRADRDLVRSEVVTESALGPRGAGEVASQLPDDTVGVTVSTGDLRPPVAADDVVDLYSVSNAYAGPVDYAGPIDVSAPDTGGSAGPHRVATSATVIEIVDDQVTVAVAAEDAADLSAASLTGAIALALVNPR